MTHSELGRPGEPRFLRNDNEARRPKRKQTLSGVHLTVLRYEMRPRAHGLRMPESGG